MDEMLFEYVRLAREHGSALDTGDTAQSNVLNAKLIDLFKRFVALGHRDRLTILHGHSDRSVRCWAAIHTLTIDPDRAQTILEALSEGDGPVAFNALVFAREWRTGSLPLEGDPLWPTGQASGTRPPK